VRLIGSLLGTAVLLTAGPALAAETVKVGPAPAWVTPQAIPQTKPTDAPVAILLSDEQISFNSGTRTVFAETALRIQNPEGLAAGNISFSWNPSTDAVTVNKLHILRDGKVIDVLGAGQTFTILRRESNLEAAILDGTLTANIQPEGLVEGDVIDLATTVETSDPVLKGHGEATYGAWNGMPFSAAHARVLWPKNVKLAQRQSPGLPPIKRDDQRETFVLELTVRDVQPLVPPKGAPARYALGRVAEVTDFNSWSDVADLFIPLYNNASQVNASGSLRNEVDRIRNSTSDPKARAGQALALVQDRVRYVALLMGQGGLVPATAETTWSRRFGDCKAKTALLLAILRQLGIEAVPVLASSNIGDALSDRLPMVGLFDHVFVRARIGGKSFWLDGTRTGDSDLDRIDTPDLGWVLPLERDASLVKLVPPPLNEPIFETLADIDASQGIYAPSPATVEKVLHGDFAVLFHSRLSNLTEAQRQEFFRSFLKSDFEFMTLKSATYSFDKVKRDLRISMTAEATIGWNGGYFHVPLSSIGFTPNWERTDGPSSDAPIAVAYPAFRRTLIKIRVPRTFIAGRKLGSPPVRETLAGVEYSRSSSLDGEVLRIETSERSLVPEIPYKEARAAEARLKLLDDEDIALPVPGTYRPTEKDLAAVAKDSPASKDQFMRRGLVFLDAGKFDEAIADFDRVIALDPKDAWALADRGVARVWKRDFGTAQKDLAAAEAIDPNNLVLLRGRALEAELKGNYESAAELYSKSLEREPESAFVLGHRALVYRALDQDQKALADSDQALKKLPSWVELRLMRASILLAEGKRDDVAQEAELMMKENPQSESAFVAAGKIYGRIDRRSDAMKAFDRALAIKPDAYVYINRAEARPRTDRGGRIADLEQSLKLDPKNPDALAEKAELLAASGDFQQAAELYDRAAKDAPDNSPLKVLSAAAMYRSGRTAEAEKTLAAFEGAAKTSADFNSLCWSKATNGILLESALANCRRAVKLAPNSAAYLDSLGFVLLRLDKLDESIQAYTAAISKRNQSASRMGRAIAYARKRDKEHAEADRTEALKLDPDAEERFLEYGLKL
jgi:tetratricopeptide (TPR) repeat protein